MRGRDLADAALVDERVERDELPGDDEHDDEQHEVGVAQPVLGQCLIPTPAPRPKLGSSSALKAMATAAEDNSSGTKYRTARSARYRWLPAVKTPSSMADGRLDDVEKNMTLAVTMRALPVTGR